jgi:hypothetical protein
MIDGLMLSSKASAIPHVRREEASKWSATVNRNSTAGLSGRTKGCQKVGTIMASIARLLQAHRRIPRTLELPAPHVSTRMEI